MKKFLIDLNNKPLNIKLPLILIIFGVFGFLTVFIYKEYSRLSTQTEVKNLNLKVGKTYYETKFQKRTMYDNFIILELVSEITKDQFDKLTFDLNPESVKADFIDTKKIKVTFISPFEKSVKRNLIVKYKEVEVYRYLIENSDGDKSFFESFPPDNPFEKVEF